MDTGSFVRSRRIARELQLATEPVHSISVPPGPDGRPGETLMATSLSRRIGVMEMDGSRTDCVILLAEHTTLNIVCFGPVSERGEPIVFAERAIRSLKGAALARWVETPRPERVAGCDGVTYLLDLGNGAQIKERIFAREGWLFGAGIFRRDWDPPSVFDRGADVLATWEWLPGSTSSSNLPWVPEVRVQVARHVGIRCAPEAVWSLLREPENAHRVLKRVTRSYVMPDGPRGVGEQHCTVFRIGRGTVTAIDELVSEHPMSRLEFRQLMPAAGATNVWEIAKTESGVLLSLAMDHPVPEGAKAEHVRSQLDTGARAMLRRVRRVLEDDRNGPWRRRWMQHRSLG